MPEVMIKCPENGEAVKVGISVERMSYGTLILRNKTLENCPACGKNHVWSKEDSFLEGNETKKS